MRSSLLFLLLLAAGCGSVPLPRTITQGDISPQRKRRNEEVTRHIDQQRDLAEYEAAKTRWVDQHDSEGCREALEKLLARRPQHCDAHLLMAELLLAEDDPQAAYQHAKAALDSSPNSAGVQYTMALVLDAQGNTSDALAYYERATKMAPQSGPLAAANRTAREAARDEIRFSKTAAAQIPASFDARADECLPTGYSAGVAPLPPGSRAGSAGVAESADSDGVAASSPVVDLLRKGQEALAEETPAAALTYFHQAADIQPDNPQIPISAAASALRANRPEVAVELLTPAAKQYPGSAAVHRMLGAAYYRAGEYKSSQVALQQALSLDKSSALSYLLLGWTLAKLGQNEAAEAHFRQARVLDPRYKVVR
jgi:tetratricopeptide (TPR) repeat protein